MRMGSSWVLRGIVSNAKINASTLKVQADSYTIFTDVAYYLNWIKTKVPDIPYLAVDTKLITETDFDYGNCSKVTYPSGTQQEREELVNLAYILNGSQSAETGRFLLYEIKGELHLSFSFQRKAAEKRRRLCNS